MHGMLKNVKLTNLSYMKISKMGKFTVIGFGLMFPGFGEQGENEMKHDFFMGPGSPSGMMKRFWNRQC